MARTPITLTELLALVDDPRAISDLATYFQPDLPTGAAPVYSGSRFEFLAGGGDRPETADRITADDLIAVSLLSVTVPSDVALKLLEGPLGADITRHLEQIPTDVAISDARAAELLGTASHASVAWDLLEEPHGMGWVTAGKLLARKRPRLVPVYDGVVQCAFGGPFGGVWQWLVGRFAEDGGVLEQRLLAARDAAGVSEDVSPLRVLDVIVWMRHRPAHRRDRCAGRDW